MELHGKAECEKAKGQMKEEAAILFPVSLYSLLLNVYRLSVFTRRGITKSTLESFVPWHSLLKSNHSLNQKKAICIKFEWYNIILHIIVDHINYCFYLQEVNTTGRETRYKKMFKANKIFFFFK